MSKIEANTICMEGPENAVELEESTGFDPRFTDLERRIGLTKQIAARRAASN